MFATLHPTTHPQQTRLQTSTICGSTVASLQRDIYIIFIWQAHLNDFRGLNLLQNSSEWSNIFSVLWFCLQGAKGV